LIFPKISSITGQLSKAFIFHSQLKYTHMHILYKPVVNLAVQNVISLPFPLFWDFIFCERMYLFRWVAASQHLTWCERNESFWAPCSVSLLLPPLCPFCGQLAV